MALVVWEAPRRERQKDKSDGRRRSLGGRRRRRTRGAPLSGDPPSSWPLCSSRRRSLPGRWGSGAGPTGEQLPVRGQRGGCWGPGPENNGHECAGLLASTRCVPRAGCTALWTAPPTAPRARRGGVASRVRALPQALRRFPDLSAATSLSLSGDQEGVLGEGGESGGRHLASGGPLLLPRCSRVEATLSRGRGFPEWSWRRGSLRAESLEMVWSVACPGGRVSAVPWTSCLTADPWRTRPRGWSVILY